MFLAYESVEPSTKIIHHKFQRSNDRQVSNAPAKPVISCRSKSMRDTI